MDCWGRPINAGLLSGKTIQKKMAKQVTAVREITASKKPIVAMKNLETGMVMKIASLANLSHTFG